MDAGLAAAGNSNNQGYGGSSKAQIRNQLLQNDIGNLDLSNEILSQQQNPTQYPQYPQYPQQHAPQHHFGQQQHPGYPNVQARGPQSQRQYPINRHSQFNRIGQGTRAPMGPNMGTPVGAHMGPPMPQPQSFQRINAPVRQAPQGSNDQGERRAYSLNQKSLSSFFKSSRFSHAKGKNQDDDDDDIMLEDGQQSMLTFHDIRKSGNKGGDRYGYGSDTAPMIPTLVTKDHNNMSNVEYRKYLFAQRKMAMNAVNKQHNADPSEPRAMSLQSYNNESPFRQGQMGPQAPGGPSYSNSRANSLMRGPPLFPNQPQSNNCPPHMSPSYMPVQGNGPRSMSLLTPQARHPVANQNQAVGQAHSQNGLPLPGQPLTGTYNSNGSSWSSENIPVPDQISETLDPSSSEFNKNNISVSSISTPEIDQEESKNASIGYKEHVISPLVTQINTSSQPQGKGQLNVLKLSAPQQNEMEEKERFLSQREKELKEKELLLKQQEADIKNTLLEKDLRSTESEQQNNLKENGAREVEESRREMEGANHHGSYSNPLPVLEGGFESLSINVGKDSDKEKPNNRVSNGTFVSTFSASPEKLDKSRNTGMYKLEKSANNSVFVTAQEFPNDLENVSDTSRISTGKELSRKDSPNTSTDTLNDGNSTLKGSIPSTDISKGPIEGKGFNLSSDTKFKKRSSFVKAKNFLRKMSSSSIAKDNDNDSHLSLRRSPSNVSIDSFPSSKNDTFHYRTENKKNNQRLSILSSSSKKVENDTQGPSIPGPVAITRNTVPEQVNSDVADSDVADPDGFNFDNTVGQRYVPLFVGNSEMKDDQKIKTITISGEQLNIINENKQLMQEITLVSMELAESIKRETILESEVKDLAHNRNFSSEKERFSLAEFEIELRKKSSKIVELIQQLNEERLKRFIAEEQLLMQENGVKPSSIELVHTISTLNEQLQEKDAEILMLKNAINDTQL